MKCVIDIDKIITVNGKKIYYAKSVKDETKLVVIPEEFIVGELLDSVEE